MCDRNTFEIVLGQGLALTRAMAWRRENGRSSYVPGRWEVIDLQGKLYGAGSSPNEAIESAFERVSRPGVWRVLAPIEGGKNQ